MQSNELRSKPISEIMWLGLNTAKRHFLVAKQVCAEGWQ